MTGGPDRVRYSDASVRDLAKLDRAWATRILAYLAERVDGSEDARQHGRPLTGARMGGLWRYRIGAYRATAEINDDTLAVPDVQAGHRSTSYR